MVSTGSLLGEPLFGPQAAPRIVTFSDYWVSGVVCGPETDSVCKSSDLVNSHSGLFLVFFGRSRGSLCSSSNIETLKMRIAGGRITKEMSRTAGEEYLTGPTRIEGSVGFSGD